MNDRIMEISSFFDPAQIAKFATHDIATASPFIPTLDNRQEHVWRLCSFNDVIDLYE